MGKFLFLSTTRPNGKLWISSRQAMRLTLALLLSTIFVNAHAKGFFDDDSEKDKKPAQEMPVLLPAFPMPENLLPFPAGPIATQSFSIDAKSLTVGPDEVRYTLVTTSKSGAQNISYEGIRCATSEVKRYAFGHMDGKWTLARSDKWMPISFLSANRPQAALTQDYFCDMGTVSGKAEQMLDRIRYNRSLLENTYKAN